MSRFALLYVGGLQYIFSSVFFFTLYDGPEGNINIKIYNFLFPFLALTIFLHTLSPISPFL